MGRQFKKGVMLAGILFMMLGACVKVQAATNPADFPESYRPYIQQMMTAHPNWTFEPYYTNVSWDSLMDYETEIAVNLIEYGSGEGDYWYAKDQQVTYNGKKINLYNYQNGSYYVLSDPNWVQPTPEVIAHYLDPRNFLNDSDIFMFKNLVYNAGYHTVDSVDAVLSGTWMYKKPLEDDPSMTYAQAFIMIGRESGMSPFMLASRVVQEQGAGTSQLISGKYPGFEGYYNYFNIGASGETREEIYRNGITEAKNEGWSTRYKALLGGAQKIAARYLDYNQTTIYFQKFDVANGQVSWHQYMQNIQAPLSEGRRIRSAYADCGILESAFVFRIPVYNNMPTSACQVNQPAMLGDVDRNGEVEAADALFVLKHVVHLHNLNDVQRILADTDGNGQIEANDALRILQYVVCIIQKF